MLQTKRLTLRNLRPEDARTLYDYRNDSRCNRYQRYDGTGMEHLEQFVRRFAGCRFLSKEEEQHYAVTQKETTEMIGDLSVFFTEKDNCFTLGITIAPSFQRKGYAFELLREVVSRLQKQYPAMDIVALIEKGNKGSIALFQKLGFVEECYADSIASYVFTIFGKKDS